MKEFKTQRCKSKMSAHSSNKIEIKIDSTCLNCQNGKQDNKGNPHASGAELKKTNRVCNKMVSEID